MATTSEKERQNLEATHRIAEEIWNEGNFDLIDELYADDAVIKSGFQEYSGPDGYREWVQQSKTGFPDFDLTLDEITVTDDVVMSHYTWHGTHEGRLDVLGAEPTGNSVEVSGIVMARFDDDGKIVEERNYPDMMTMLGQIGMLPEGMAP